jgi:hypothetical protein
MSITEITTTSIAFLSFLFSLFVILRDRKARRYDLLYKFYERISDTFAESPIIPTDNYDVFENSGLTPENNETLAKQKNISDRVEKELNTACYYLNNGQLDKKQFFELFGKWLSSRYRIWPSIKKYNMVNYSHTWKAIQYYQSKNYLRNVVPINDFPVRGVQDHTHSTKGQ